MRFVSAAVFALAALSFAACGEPDPRIAEIEAIDGNAAFGSEVYVTHCASCHADDGSGGTGPDLTAHGDHSEAEIISYVLNGKGIGMPAFADTLSNQEIADVVAHLETLHAD